MTCVPCLGLPGPDPGDQLPRSSPALLGSRQFQTRVPASTTDSDWSAHWPRCLGRPRVLLLHQLWTGDPSVNISQLNRQLALFYLACRDIDKSFRWNNRRMEDIYINELDKEFKKSRWLRGGKENREMRDMSGSSHSSDSHGVYSAYSNQGRRSSLNELMDHQEQIFQEPEDGQKV